MLEGEEPEKGHPGRLGMTIDGEDAAFLPGVKGGRRRIMMRAAGCRR